ncbi:MAG: VRR-NUC domain-containing protein [Candidatus Helarchaeota archaeon]
MNVNEKTAEEIYRCKGYDVVRVGKPDLILLKDGKVEFVEIKTSSKNQISKAQYHAIDLLRKHGFEARIEMIEIHNPQVNEDGSVTFEPVQKKLY